MSEETSRTGIIATLGPASANPETISKLIDSGVNVFRLNFSHGDQETHKKNVKIIRSQARNLERPIGILQDLQGPKIRVQRFAEGSIELHQGQEFILDCAFTDDGDEKRVGVSYSGLCLDVTQGERLLLDDGRLELKVKQVKEHQIKTMVVRGGKLSNHKGINLPGCDLKIPALSDKDVDDMRCGAELDVDWIAVSFVRNRDDILLARHYMQRFSSKAKLMAKIEKPSAVDRFEDILEAVDGVMIARGDLGVELSAAKVPIIQKRLIRMCREAGKPVVTATQMLESMISNPTPTRAEASDVANAIYDGTDSVMLSAETAVGEFPIESVKIMNEIALSVESDEGYQRDMREQMVEVEHTVADSVAHAACQMARDIGATVIVTFSSSGATALRVARQRTSTRVLAVTPNILACRQLSIAWGVHAFESKSIHSSDEMVAEANRCILAVGVAKPGDRYVITAGVPFGISGTTNLIRAETVVAA